ncbi:MAG: XRE family transcriptional regulator [Pseudomonadota bacterium]|nr:XRE family transcriptional regulator [Pseudomonadota bacterium]
MPLADHLAANLRQLREARGLSQTALARKAGLPRATWTHLESGGANPTLVVLAAAAEALGVRIEELLAEPAVEAHLYRRDTLPTRAPGNARVRRLLPDPLPGTEIERFELPPGGRFTGIPHTRGTREYLTCESGHLALTVAGGRFELGPGDVVVFRGDQRHGYENPGEGVAVGYSVVLRHTPDEAGGAVARDPRRVL